MQEVCTSKPEPESDSAYSPNVLTLPQLERHLFPATERIVAVGADFKNNVSTKADTLIIGDADFVQFADGVRTGKMRNAAELKDGGHEIEIIAEREFLALLHS